MKRSYVLPLLLCLAASARLAAAGCDPLAFRFTAVGDINGLDESSVTGAVYNATGAEVEVRKLDFATRTVYALYNFTEEVNADTITALEDAFSVILADALADGSIGDVNVLSAVEAPVAEAKDGEVSIKSAEGEAKTLLVDVEVKSANGSSLANAEELAGELRDLDWEAFQSSARDTMRSFVASSVPNAIAKYMEDAVVVAVVPSEPSARLDVLLPNDCETSPTVHKAYLQAAITNGWLADSFETHSGDNVVALETRQYLTDSIKAVPAAPTPKSDEAEAPAIAPGPNVAPSGDAGDALPELGMDGDFNENVEAPALAPSIDEDKLAEAAAQQNGGVAGAFSGSLLLAAAAAAALLAL